jgi:leucyl aminopeptidase
MKISFSEKINSNDNLVIIYSNKNSLLNKSKLSVADKNLIEKVEKLKKSKESFTEFFTIPDGKKIKKVLISKIKSKSGTSYTEALAGRILSQLERNNIEKVTVIIEVDPNRKDLLRSIKDLAYGFLMKDYRFEKYKTITKKDFKILSISFAFAATQSEKKILENHIQMVKGIYLTRDLVSEPANELYPEKFVQLCNVLKKVGIKSEILNEKQIKKLGMNALMGVAQGSVKPPRVLVMKWNGKKDTNFANPLSFIGKGVTFDTGGISIKPSGGMEDMKWDMGGAAVVAGLMYTLAIRKSKANVVGIVGLVENMPDGNAQRPGDIVKSMSGQTIEVLNTDAEGRLVLADVITYVRKKYKPSLMIDLATLTGAIIVALGDRYAGLFSNSDSLAKKIQKSSISTQELVWRLPMDSKFDKLLDCSVADMKNITGTRGAGSITAAQFIKRFVGEVDWAHLDIAGVTWSKRGTDYSRPGGTGFGVRLLDNFVKENYE